MSARLPQVLRSAPLLRSPLQLCCGRSVCDPRRKSRMSGRGGCQHGHPYRARGGIGKRIASTDVDLSALDSRNAMANEIACVAKVHFQTITGATNLQQEIGTKTYILSKLFCDTCPLVKGYTSVITWINKYYASFERQVHTTSLCTSFAYNLSRTEAAYYNICIWASTMVLTGDPGGQTLVSFTILLDNLTWG